MSVDYYAQTSSNIKLTDDMVEYAISMGHLREGFWDDPMDYFESSDIPFGIVQYGSYYSGELEYYLDLPSNNIITVHTLLSDFVSDIKKYFGVTIDIEDVNIYSNVLVW